MRFKVVVEFIQSTDPADFKLKGKKTPERIAKVMLDEYESSNILDSIKYAEYDKTVKVLKVEYLDDEF